MEPLRRIEIQRIFLEKGFQSIKDWAEKRGFSRWLVYKVLEGKGIRGRRGGRIAKALLEDFGIDILKLHNQTSSSFLKDCKGLKPLCEDKNGGQGLARESKNKGRNGHGRT